eukprot:641631_1
MSLTLKVSTSLWLIFKSTGLHRKRRKHAISNTIEESKTWKVDIEHYAEDVEERYRNQHVTHFSNVMNHKLDSKAKTGNTKRKTLATNNRNTTRTSQRTKTKGKKNAKKKEK